MDPPPPLAVAALAVTENKVTLKVKFARTSEFAVRVIAQSTVVLLQLVALLVPSIQPEKVDPPLAVARITSAVPLEYDAAQAPNAPPFALHDTEPVPIPWFGRIVRVAGGGATGNVAVTDESVLTVITHGPAPVQVALPVPLPHPVNPAPVAVNVTTVSLINANEQVPAAQSMPDGLDVTEPLFTIVTDTVLNELPKCVVAVASETSGSPGNAVSKPGSEKSRVAGKPTGGVAGTWIELPAAGTPPSVSSN
jgi:hypothetical protein